MGAPHIPTPAEIITARTEVGLTQKDAAALIYKTPRAWQQYEAADRALDPALWELFRLKVVLIKNGLIL